MKMRQSGSEKQLQTSECFSYKWARRDTYESESVKAKSRTWLVERYFGSEEERARFIAENRGKSIMDAGCGSGFSAALLFGKDLNDMSYLGVDISDAVETAGQRFSDLGIKGEFLKESLTEMRLGRNFDIIFSEGVLHHTSDPFGCFRNLVSHLKEGGLLMFYVYRRKAPVREFVDDYIREGISHLDDGKAWDKLMPLTKLGKALGDLGAEIEIDEDIEMLRIPKGRYNVQRLFYWFFVKAFYDKSYSLEEMNHINFDWYRPLNCYRFEPEEIEGWLAKTGLEKVRVVVEEAGITAVAVKR